MRGYLLKIRMPLPEYADCAPAHQVRYDIAKLNNLNQMVAEIDRAEKQKHIDELMVMQTEMQKTLEFIVRTRTI